MNKGRMAANALIDQEFALGILVVCAGLIVTAFPGLFATMNEAFDAVGSKKSDVEPTRWKVLLTRVIGIGITLGGAWFLLTVYNVSRWV